MALTLTGFLLTFFSLLLPSCGTYSSPGYDSRLFFCVNRIPWRPNCRFPFSDTLMLFLVIKLFTKLELRLRSTIYSPFTYLITVSLVFYNQEKAFFVFLVHAAARRLGCVLLRGEITVLFPSWQAVGWDNMAFVFLNRYLDLSEVSHLFNLLKT